MKSKKEFGTVYMITCIVTGMIYVGQTTTTLKRRLMRHMYCAFNEKETAYTMRLCEAIREFGEAAFRIVALEENIPVNLLRKRERDWIWELHSNDPTIGYNKQDGLSVIDSSEYWREYREIHEDERLAKRSTPEAKQKKSEYDAKYYDSLSPEKKADKHRKSSERQRNKRASMTKEERKEYDHNNYLRRKAKKASSRATQS